MKRSKLLIYSLYILIIIYFVSYWAVYQGLISNNFSRLPEIVILLVFGLYLSAFRPEKFNFTGIRYILPFFFVVLISAILNSTPILELLLFIKNFFTFYLILLLLANVRLPEEDLIKVVKFIYNIFLLQIPVSIIKLLIFGQNETPLGFVGSNLTSYFFLMSEAFSFSFYLTTGKRKFLFHCFLFLMIPLIGSKRVAIFILPFLCLILYFIYTTVTHDRNLKKLLFSVLLIIISSYLFIRIIPTLNPEKKVWGKFSLAYAFKYGQNYSNAYDPYSRNVAIGRNTAVSNAVTILNKERSLHRYFGVGPGSIAKTSIEELDNRNVITDRFKIRYGTNSFIYFLVQTGWLGAILLFIFYLSFIKAAYKSLRRSKDPFWSSFYLVVISFTLIFSFFAFYYDAVHKMGVIIIFYYIIVGIFINHLKTAQE